MRLDEYLVKNEYFLSRNKAAYAIKNGEVYLDGAPCFKAARIILENSAIKVEVKKQSESFVSLGGNKLEKALSDFNFDVKGLVVADVGASTGGFTDCLLMRGASAVYAVDLNDEQLDNSLKNNSKVFPIIKNAKFLTIDDFSLPLDLITADLSFISETAVLPVFKNLLKDGKHAVILIKPQFECGIKKRFKNGIINDEEVRKTARDNVCACAIENGFIPLKITTAPIKDGKNVEYLVLLLRSDDSALRKGILTEKLF